MDDIIFKIQYKMRNRYDLFFKTYSEFQNKDIKLGSGYSAKTFHMTSACPSGTEHELFYNFTLVAR